MPTPLIFSFDTPPTDQATWIDVLGGKGAGLARMRALGLPVPPWFTIPTDICHRVLADGWSPDLDDAVAAGLAAIEAAVGRRLGAADDPLLVSVRSGAPISMPGMMDTVLNVGLTAAAAGGLAAVTGDAAFAEDTRRRFVESWDAIVGGPIPDDPVAQVVAAIRAVFGSWRSERAEVYRREAGISADLGTAATVQAMVFGNRNDASGTGVAFTRDPTTGEPGLVGDFLVKAQGEDVVAGTHRTESIADLVTRWPEIGRELKTMAMTLERDLADMVDIELTVEDGRLWLLQARVGKRSPRAALRAAVDMADEPEFPIDRATAVARIQDLLDNPPRLPAPPGNTDGEILTRGLAASPGVAAGALCVDVADAVASGAAGRSVILVRPETSPADVAGMAAAQGLLTTTGGLVSHAAVVAREWGLPAVVGASSVAVEADSIVIDGQRLAAGTEITVDGDYGVVLLGSHGDVGDEVPEAAVLRAWRDELTADGGGTTTGESDAVSQTVTSDGALRALVLKGMADAAGVAGLLGTDAGPAAAVLDDLVATGLAQTAVGDRYMLTPEGTAVVDELYAAEAEDAAAPIEEHFDEFNRLNHRFKEVVTDWQMRTVDGELVPNDHTDADYDRAVVEALRAEIHTGIVAIIDAVSPVLARIGDYGPRLGAALAALEAGDQQMMAHPLKESYHTVWFELHEELIRLSGRNRADEAAAGRA